MITLPTAAGATTEYEDFYETTLAAPVGASDTDIYPTTMPNSAVGFLVIDPLGANPEIIFYNVKGANYVRVPSNTDGEGRGVGTTSPRAFDAGTKIGMYSIAEFYEGIVTGAFMRDGFLQSRHFSSSIDPNSWIGTGETWNYVGSNGQKEFQYVVAGDKTTKYQKGMKVRMPRITTVPYQSMNFVATSSQYARKTTPSAGMNVGSAYTFEVDYNLRSYTGAQQTWFTHADSAQLAGFKFGLTGKGQLYAQYFNNVGSINHFWVTYLSVPLDEQSTVSIAVDNTAQTVVFYLNGMIIPCQQTTNSGAHSTPNNGDLVIGATAAGTAEFADASFGEIRLWSTARSQAQVKDNLNRSLVGNEAGLIFLAKGNGNFNDSTANANHLTSVNGAVSTYTTKTQFKAVEFGVLMEMAFSAGNTTMTVHTGVDHIAPPENLTGVGYSAARNPYGFPGERAKWRVQQVANDQLNVGIAGAGWGNPGLELFVPSGVWLVGFDASVQFNPTPNIGVNCKVTVSTTQTTETDKRFTCSGNSSVTHAGYGFPASRQLKQVYATQTKVFLNVYGNGAGAVYLRGDDGIAILYADNPYL